MLDCANMTITFILDLELIENNLLKRKDTYRWWYLGLAYGPSLSFVVPVTDITSWSWHTFVCVLTIFLESFLLDILFLGVAAHYWGGRRWVHFISRIEALILLPCSLGLGKFLGALGAASRRQRMWRSEVSHSSSSAWHSALQNKISLEQCICC